MSQQETPRVESPTQNHGMSWPSKFLSKSILVYEYLFILIKKVSVLVNVVMKLPRKELKERPSWQVLSELS